MLFLWLVAFVSFMFGFLFLFMPKALVRLSTWANQVLIYTDEKLYKLRIGLGICLLLVSITAFFIIYYISVKY